MKPNSEIKIAEWKVKALYPSDRLFLPMIKAAGEGEQGLATTPQVFKLPGSDALMSAGLCSTALC